MLVTVLGFYGGYPHNGIGTSGYLLQNDGKKMLVDCGSGVLNALANYMNPTDLDAVILSHYHHDHTADIGVLQYEWLAAKKEKLLPIYGHTQDFVNFAQLSVDNATKGIAYNDYEPSEIDGMKFEFLRTVHPVPAYAMRITDKNGKVIVYTADTTYFDGLVDFAKDADLLIADTNFPEDVTGRKAHLNTKEAGTLAKDANVKRLMISHLPQTVDAETMLSQSQKYAGDIPVVHAFQGLEINV
ncbi:beta-lactamase superfamily hydrolase [Companilactobacillus mindensis DSM 14500]|jgi:Metal-dependent hydrolases of the beta-lactamase superfamily III|uniref:Beta-lactamase superfamily hydrolase n=1 Tax=Companilactobacillus mindensis DSM 14500 TaxID=1423770 RepID=A0A0R1QEB9_9LACO|nr:MBL fold metallo-hydrolase [Companilactobacillus mindensis]KRL43142.1 beta-lactamase superfamily hydrolase [Companilactobacillus mindensis DSM 14500]GEO78417.1 MBL fold metallo-hydrolase [Companilactobacillus mindensis]